MATEVSAMVVAVEDQGIVDETVMVSVEGGAVKEAHDIIHKAEQAQHQRDAEAKLGITDEVAEEEREFEDMVEGVHREPEGVVAKAKERFQQAGAKMEGKFEQIQDQVVGGVKKVEGAFDAAEGRVNDEIDKVEGRFDAADRKLTDQFDKFEGDMEAEIEKMEAKIESMEEKIENRAHKLSNSGDLYEGEIMNFLQSISKQRRVTATTNFGYRDALANPAS